MNDGARYCAEMPSSKLELISQYRDNQIMLQHAKAGALLSFDIGESFEFYYICRGSLTAKDGMRLVEGSYFDTYTMECKVFTADTDVTVLYYSCVPIFGTLFNEISELLELAKLVELKDGYTKEHCSRIQELAKSIGEYMQLPDSKIVNLLPGAFLHDLGKVDIPDSILGKKGSLTQEEWAQMKMHPIYGSQRLTAGKHQSIAYIVEQHHERIDGKGYPLGLVDAQISVEAKIVSVADAFDAMTNDRPYRAALSQDEAIARLLSGVGTQFDGKVVDALINVLNVGGV